MEARSISPELRARSTRRASQVAKRAWSVLHKPTKTNPTNVRGVGTDVSPSGNHPKRAKMFDSFVGPKLSEKGIEKTSKDERSRSRYNKSRSSSRSRASERSNSTGISESDFVTISSSSSKIKIECDEFVGVPDGREENDLNSDKADCKENVFVEDGRSRSRSNDDSDTEGISDYMQIREQNLRANKEFLARIGMQKAKEDFESSVAKKKPTPSQRGLKPNKKEVEPLPRRHSLRIRRIDPKGVPLPEPEPEIEDFEEQRLPETMSMAEAYFSKDSKDQGNNEDLNLKPFLSTITSLDSKQNSISSIKSNSPENAVFVKKVQKLKITEEQVAKAVPGRIYSLAWHPSKDCMIALAGDKNGYIGCWNVLAKDDNADIVRAFRPHIKPVTHLFVPPKDGHKLYTSSYDATLRCGDFEKGVFDLVFSVPEENDDLFRNFDFLGDSSSMLVSHFRGLVSLVDTRTSSKSAEQVFKVSQYSLRKVSVHPVSSHYFITAGRDAKINLWDLRAMNPKNPKAVQCLKGHSKAIASAYFSPISGNQILSCSSDDTIQIYSVTKGMNFELTSCLRHNNHTGRWLTPFQPTWHPTVEGIFVSGSMARPRQIEVFTSNGQLVRNLVGDYLASVCSLNVFHPTRQHAVVGANSSGRLHVFM